MRVAGDLGNLHLAGIPVVDFNQNLDTCIGALSWRLLPQYRLP